MPSAETLTTMLAFSEALFKSGLLPNHIKSPQAAFAIIQKGVELSIPPMYAMSNITVIQGKPTANAELMLALIYRDHGDGAIQFAETTSERCIVAYKRHSWPAYKNYEFTIEDARRAALMSNQTWQKYPAAMLRARCISAVARLAFPDSIGGMYTPEEMGAPIQMTDDGDIYLASSAREPTATAQPDVVDAELIEEPTGEQEREATDANERVTQAQVDEIGELWTALLDLKVYKSTQAMQAELIDQFGVTGRTELTRGQASLYIKTLKHIKTDAEAKLTASDDGMPI